MTGKDELKLALLKAIRDPVIKDPEFQRTIVELVMYLFAIKDPKKLISNINEGTVSVVDKVVALLRPGLKQCELDVKALSDRIDTIEAENRSLKEAVKILSLCIEEK